MTRSRIFALAALMACLPMVALADTVTVTVNRLLSDGKVGPAIGTVRFADGASGLSIRPRLSGLQPGPHGFHVHQNPKCGSAEKNGKVVPGLQAGGHYDPGNTGKHEGPNGNGHLGDLPILVVGNSGQAMTVIVAPRLTVAQIKGRALMIHSGGDNYSDKPKALGGGGARVACGVIE